MTDRDDRPDAVPVDADAVPDALQDREQWVAWRYEWDDDRDEWTKIPVDVGTGGFAKSTDPDTWAPFDEVLAYHERTDTTTDGVGFVVCDEDLVTGIDLDDCRDAATGEIEPWARDLVDEVPTYWEVSPSGTGLRGFGFGFVPDGGTRADVPGSHGHLEMYETGRYLTVTGARLEDVTDDVAQVNDAIADVHAEYIRDEDGDDEDGSANTQTPPATPALDVERSGSSGLTDDDKAVFRNALANDDTGYFFDLWTGDWEQHTDRWDGGSSHSEADLALCSLLAKHTDDAEQIDRLFRRSGLYREKWDRDDYAERTIATALQGATDDADEGHDRATNPGEHLSDDSTIDVALTPAEVCAWAGLAEDEDVTDLTDREKAACVWGLVYHHEDYHVRVRRDNGELWAYDDGIWKPEGERALRHAARQALGSMNYGANVLTELKAQARSDDRVEVQADEFGVDPGMIAVENGLLNLDAAADGADDDAIRELRPDDYALTRLPVEYEPDATADEWKEFVGDVVQPEKIDAVQEYVGYALHRGTMPYSKALLLVGSGSNGKTTFLNVVRDLLGEDHTTTKPVHKFDEDNHVADLYGALANIDADLSEGSLSSEGIATFKRLVGGDKIDARKLYEDAFTFKPTAKHLYACNQVPDVSTYVSDHDVAFWRRWIVVEFPNYFPPGARDPDLEDRLTTDDTLAGVLNWAIDGWARLRDQDGFTNVETHDETRQLWQSWGESVEKFIAECVERDEDADRISTGDAYARYQAWCRQNGADAVGRRRFTDTLKQEDVDYGKHRIDGTSQLGYKALGLSDDVPELEDDKDDEDDGDGSQTSLV